MRSTFFGIAVLLVVDVEGVEAAWACHVGVDAVAVHVVRATGPRRGAALARRAHHLYVVGLRRCFTWKEFVKLILALDVARRPFAGRRRFVLSVLFTIMYFGSDWW